MPCADAVTLAPAGYGVSAKFINVDFVLTAGPARSTMVWMPPFGPDEIYK